MKYTPRKVGNLYVKLRGEVKLNSRLPNTHRIPSHTHSTFKLFALRIVVRTSTVPSQVLTHAIPPTSQLFAPTANCVRARPLWRTVRPAP